MVSLKKIGSKMKKKPHHIPARPTRRPQYANCSICRLSVLHHLDTIHGRLLFHAVLSICVRKGLSTHSMQPFVDEDQALHSLFPPRVWAIRIPVILIILFTTVVGSFLSVVIIRSNRKKALKAQQKKAS